MNEFEQIAKIIAKQWGARKIEMLWRDLEDILVRIHKANSISDSDKCYLTREAIDAWTRRGHFEGSY